MELTRAKNEELMALKNQQQTLSDLLEKSWGQSRHRTITEIFLKLWNSTKPPWKPSPTNGKMLNQQRTRNDRKSRKPNGSNSNIMKYMEGRALTVVRSEFIMQQSEGQQHKTGISSKTFGWMQKTDAKWRTFWNLGVYLHPDSNKLHKKIAEMFWEHGVDLIQLPSDSWNFACCVCIHAVKVIPAGGKSRNLQGTYCILAVRSAASKKQNLGALSMTVLTCEVESRVPCLEARKGKNHHKIIVRSCHWSIETSDSQWHQSNVQV